MTLPGIFSHTEDVQWLVSGDAERWLRRAAMDQRSQLAQLDSLRRDLSAVRAALIVQTAALRRRATTKFPFADRLFFHEKGLEQATPWVIASYKANRYAPDADVADLACGIGGDLLGLATRGPIHGIDRDRSTVLLSTANLSATTTAWPYHIQCGTADESMVAAVEAWHVDPDRRNSPRRTSHPDRSDPPLTVLQQWCRVNPQMGAKLAPGITVDRSWWPDAEWEWIGFSKQCSQLMVWHGQLARAPGQRVATVLDAHAAPQQLVGLPCSAPTANQIEDYIIEPHPAILAAQLAGCLARQISAQRVDLDSPYLTSGTVHHDNLTRSFRVTDVIPFDRKRIKVMLRSRAVGHVEVKGRLPDVEANQFSQQLKNSRGSGTITLILSRHRGRSVAILADRITS